MIRVSEEADWPVLADQARAARCCAGCRVPLAPSAGARCRRCAADARPLVHETAIRCPACLRIREVDDVDALAESAGVHDASCDSCGASFQVTTEIRRRFVSPGACG